MPPHLMYKILFPAKVFLLVLPGGVLEWVFVVEGHEEPEDGEEHDSVAGDHQQSSSPVNLKF